ncbi:MAG: autotransporter outer membrane beta-barrel domain-containing protein [Phyllobacteriaceae bacterium]|jgi:hypothetical protein|nr:autotransporter outer membrane beta-barrel domain-containing protein [Phyllobacteriaceae bacterium]
MKMTVERHVLRRILLGTASGVAIALTMTAMTTDEALAQECTVNGAPDAGGTVTGTAGDDTIACTNAPTSKYSDIVGNNGNDTITITDSFIDNIADADVRAGSGNDIITVTGSTIASDVDGDQDDDQITVTNSSVGDDIRGEEGNDTITVNGTTTVGRDISSGTGDDILNLNGGSVTRDVTTFSGNDTVNINGIAIAGDVDTGTDDDTVTMNSGSVGGDIDTGGGDDTVNLGGGTLTGIVDLNVATPTGQDTVNFTGGTTTISGIVQTTNRGVVNFATGSTVNLTGAHLTGAQRDVVSLGEDADQMDLIGVTLNANDGSGGFWNLDFGTSDDTMTIDGGSVVNANIDMGTGADSLTIGNATINGQISGSGTTGDVFNINPGATLNAGIGSGDLFLGDFGDDFNINGGTINPNTLDAYTGVPARPDRYSLFAAGGTDEVGLFGGTINGIVNLGGGADILVIDAGGDEFTSRPDMPGTSAAPGLTPGSAFDALDISNARFDGDAGADDVFVFDLPGTSSNDLVFKDFDDAYFYGQTFSFDNTPDGSGRQQNSIQDVYLYSDATGTPTTLQQFDGALEIFSTPTSSVFGDIIIGANNGIDMVDGVADDSITVRNLDLAANSFVRSDVNISTRVADTVRVQSNVNQPNSGTVTIDTRIIQSGAVDATGSVAIIDDLTRVDPDTPTSAAGITPSTVFVFANDPSGVARTFFLVDEGGSSNGVFLQWVTPVNNTTMAAPAAAASAGAAATGGAVGGVAGTVVGAVVGGIVSGAGPAPGSTPRLSGDPLIIEAPDDPDRPDIIDPERPRDVVDTLDDDGLRARRSFAGTCHDNISTWVDLSAARMERGATASGSAFDADSYGITVGADVDLGGYALDRCDMWRVGLFGNLGRTDVSVAGGSMSEIGSWLAGVYTSARYEQFYGTAMAFYGMNDTTTVNTTLFNATTNEDSATVGGAGAVGALFQVASNLYVDPRISGHYLEINGDPYSDQFGLQYETHTTAARVEGSIGLIYNALNQAGLPLSLEWRGGIAWDRTQSKTASLGAVSTATHEEVLFNTSVKVTTNVTETFRVYGRIGGEFGADTTSFNGNVGFRVRF